MKILIIGYFGKGNFGDDVLFTVTYRLAKKHFENANFSVLCDQYKDHYLPKLIQDNIRVIHPGNKECFDLIIHGGGGTFFDYSIGKYSDYFINKLIKIIGNSLYSKLDLLLRKILNKNINSAAKRIGFGIGVGTYTKSSVKLKYNIPVLLDFDRLNVRDELSKKNLNKLNFNKNIKIGSDLAFLSYHWAPKNAKNTKVTNSKLNIGIALRDWNLSNSNNYIDNIVKIITGLNHKYEFTFFIFDKREDKELIHKTKNCNTQIWDPLTLKLDGYSSSLAQQDVIITSRAHAAICGAVMGVPSIIIEIEPKLRTIHQLIPNSSCILNINQLDIKIIDKHIYAMNEISEDQINIEVLKNQKLMEKIIESTIEIV